MPKPLSTLVIAGPTGVGKTALAVDVCLELGGEIVGADSVQVYRGFDIGSSKPTAKELKGIRHHLIDVVEPNEPMDAARYAQLADAAIADIHGRGMLPVVVGGTGLWLRALLRGLLELPKSDPQLRHSIEVQWQREGADAAFRRLREVDPISAASIHSNDRLRVVRALEVHAQTGRALGELRKAHALGKPKYNALGLCVDLPIEHYRQMVAMRTRAMLDDGLGDEVAALLTRFGPDVRAMSAVGYRQMRDHLLRVPGSDAADVAEDIVRATLLYARRQRTWFARDPNIHLRCDPASARQLDILQRLHAQCGDTLTQ